MYSTRATSGSRPLIPPASVLPPPAAVLTPPDSSFLHRRIPDSRLIVAPQVPHITIQFLQGKGSLDLFSLDLPLPASCESASVQGSPLQQNKSPRRSGKSEISAPRLPRIDISQPSPTSPTFSSQHATCIGRSTPGPCARPRAGSLAQANDD
ncbi:hypothetical protein LshimejAT787_0805100 [Lyophyllum shimeji]|uniref:Uncharacterized protein n=1 Tax=Lyophyllum shimeji TaxID=47721 RepID=A0A9P3PSA2_LYOSH|nr:hypothetical protein LshimejAT787_0805100 [Lyophyllum shimeji]